MVHHLVPLVQHQDDVTPSLRPHEVDALEQQPQEEEVGRHVGADEQVHAGGPQAAGGKKREGGGRGGPGDEGILIVMTMVMPMLMVMVTATVTVMFKVMDVFMVMFIVTVVDTVIVMVAVMVTVVFMVMVGITPVSSFTTMHPLGRVRIHPSRRAVHPLALEP